MGSRDSNPATDKLKEIDGRTPQGVESAAQFDSTRDNLPGPVLVRMAAEYANMIKYRVVHGRFQHVG